MTNDSRAFKLWMNFSSFVLPFLALLSVVLMWPPGVQVTLTVLFFGAVLGNRFALARRCRER
jgi:hypothetical protein